MLAFVPGALATSAAEIDDPDPINLGEPTNLCIEVKPDPTDPVDVYTCSPP